MWGESQVDIVSSWNIAENLPKATQVLPQLEIIQEHCVYYMKVQQDTSGPTDLKIPVNLVAQYCNRTQLILSLLDKMLRFINLCWSMQDHFILIVSEFMYIPRKYAREHAALRASTSDGDLCTPSITAALAETFDLQMAEDLKKKV